MIGRKIKKIKEKPQTNTKTKSFYTVSSGVVVGIGSINTEVVFSFFTLIFGFFLSGTNLKDKAINPSPERTIKVVFQKPGSPKKGIRNMKTPRKNVLLFWIMGIL